MRAVIDRNPDFETLSAYVDGELDAAHAARIADLAAGNPAIAQRIAKLHELRAAVGALSPDVVVLPLPRAARSRPASRSGRLLSGWRAAAAGMLLAVGLSALGWGLAGPDGSLAPGGWLATAVERHDRWANAPIDRATMVGLADETHAFLLARSGLNLAHRGSWRTEDGRLIVHTGYLGSRGCRLSLFEIARDERAQTAGDGTEDGVAITYSNMLLQATWRTAQAEYVLLARKMDETRFAVLARALHETTVTPAEPTATLLARIETARQPCLA